MILAGLPLLLFLAGLAVVRSAVPAILCRSHPWNARARGFERCRQALLALLAIALAMVFVQRVAHADWHYLFWSQQFPMLLFAFGSGVLLAETWERDRRALWGEQGRRRLSGAWLFLGGLSLLWCAGMASQLLVSEPRPNALRSPSPIAALFALGAYGFGGPLPADLAAITAAERERGYGHLPRNVTVPAAAALLAAWLWIGFAGLALLLRWTGTRMRPLAPLLPCLVLLAVQVLWSVGVARIGPFDVRLLSVEADYNSGIWRSDSDQLLALGPVLVMALLLAAALAFLQRRDRRGAQHMQAKRQSLPQALTAQNPGA
jgi:uncharacterized integral membrane protein